ncbi:hypothetical protein DFH07DRAFT_961917 [Mycena maculata]|uniref:Uncharacterized protein n=1 Tax=Mycena maculata TaxID=230809 RepID=A0AAD7ITI2_9AGAR|nr:hypothetical protein DFH07DRAFT_961917 [Mycena maculata]
MFVADEKVPYSDEHDSKFDLGQAAMEISLRSKEECRRIGPSLYFDGVPTNCMALNHAVFCDNCDLQYEVAAPAIPLAMPASSFPVPRKALKPLPKVPSPPPRAHPVAPQAPQPPAPPTHPVASDTRLVGSRVAPRPALSIGPVVGPRMGPQSVPNDDAISVLHATSLSNSAPPNSASVWLSHSRNPPTEEHLWGENNFL